MLTAKDAKGDLVKINDRMKEKGATLTDVVEVVGLVVKLLLGIRGNQVMIMKKMGIEFPKPRPRDDSPETTK